MESMILAFMLFFAPSARAADLQPYANHILRASDSPELLSELFVHGRNEGLWGQRGVPMGVTAWSHSRGRMPNVHEAVCASLATINSAIVQCGDGRRHLVRRLGYYLTGRCVSTPEAQRRARSVIAMTRVFGAAQHNGAAWSRQEDVLTCPAGE